MAKGNDIGKKGEEAAALYLARKGYRLRARNWRYGHLEVDIIAEHRGVLVFVEVKSSKDNYFGEPEYRVDLRKKMHLIKAANAYIRYYNLFMNSRFDIISVLEAEEPYSIRHIENAFSMIDTKLKMGY